MFSLKIRQCTEGPKTFHKTGFTFILEQLFDSLLIHCCWSWTGLGDRPYLVIFVWQILVLPLNLSYQIYHRSTYGVNTSPFIQAILCCFSANKHVQPNMCKQICANKHMQINVCNQT